MNNKINKFICTIFALSFILLTIFISVLVVNHEISTIEYFFDVQAAKKETYSTSIDTFKQLADDRNLSQETRNSAAVKAMDLATKISIEYKIEATLKAAGYKYVICFIDTNHVRIIIKPPFIFTGSKAQNIINTVTNLTSIKNISLTIKR